MWVKANVESMVAVVLAVAMSVLGLVDVIPTDLVSKVIPLTLGVIAFAMLRDRWRQETVNAEIQTTITTVGGTLREVNERMERIPSINELQQTLDGLSTVRFVIGAEVTDVLEEARTGTDRWIFKGGTGTHTRVVTLPVCIRQAQRDHRQLKVRLEILDPTKREVCDRYAQLYKALADEDDDARTWDAKGTQIELYATILAACCHKQQLGRLLDIEIALTSSVSMFRWDLSSRYLILTQRGPRFPAMVVEKGRPYYDSWDFELGTSFDECRRVPIEHARNVPLREEPSIPEVRSLFEVLGLALPENYTDADVVDIITKALHDTRRPLRGAGDRLPRGA
ncbi:hypothetical protein AB0E01_13270 [Nocardia vinacea]|uniref:hypothetical protein n=1 Tax=Nocardia vinacea TaxID=96468 RepID=UPI0033D34380